MQRSYSTVLLLLFATLLLLALPTDAHLHRHTNRQTSAGTIPPPSLSSDISDSDSTSSIASAAAAVRERENDTELTFLHSAIESDADAAAASSASVTATAATVSAVSTATTTTAPTFPPTLTDKGLLFFYMTLKSLSLLTTRLHTHYTSGSLSPHTPLFIGSYGISTQFNTAVARLRARGVNAHFTPLYSLVRKRQAWWQARQPVNGTVSPSSPAYSGAIPQWVNLTLSEKYEWAVELGRRFRDDIEEGRVRGMNIQTWAIDEVSSSAWKPVKGVGITTVMRGMLIGISEGRKNKQGDSSSSSNSSNSRNDSFMSGLVYFANLGSLTPPSRQTPSLRALWHALNATCHRIVEEEYPVFNNASAAAMMNNHNDIALAKLGGSAASLANRLVSGMTPGYQPGPLNGVYVGNRRLPLTPAQVSQWRADYTHDRSHFTTAGIGEFAFVGGNEDADIINRCVDDMVLAARHF